MFATSASAYSTPDTGISGVIESSSIAIHATVTKIDTCLSDDGGDAFTFATVQVHEVLRGQLLGAPSGTFTFRLPVGPYPDGTFGTVVGYPQLSIGDEALFFLRYSADGTPVRLPYGAFAESVIRLLPVTGQSEKAVVDGTGVVYAHAEGGFPSGQRRLDLAVSEYIWDPPIDEQDLAPALAALFSNTWSGGEFAQGDWGALVRIDATDSLGEYDSGCIGMLSGTASSTQITMTGTCNAAHVGKVHLDFTGVPDGQGGWGGALVITASAVPAYYRTISWTSDSQGSSNDQIIGGGSGLHAELGHVIDWDFKVALKYVGPRAPVEWPVFRQAMIARLVGHSESQGLGQHVQPSQTTCNQPVVLEAMP